MYISVPINWNNINNNTSIRNSNTNSAVPLIFTSTHIVIWKLASTFATLSLIKSITSWLLRLSWYPPITCLAGQIANKAVLLEILAHSVDTDHSEGTQDPTWNIRQPPWTEPLPSPEDRITSLASFSDRRFFLLLMLKLWILLSIMKKGRRKNVVSGVPVV